MWETGVQSPGQEDPLEKEMATHSSIHARKILWTEEPGGATVHSVAKSRTRLSDFSLAQLYPTVYEIGMKDQFLLSGNTQAAQEYKQEN